MSVEDIEAALSAIANRVDVIDELVSNRTEIAEFYYRFEQLSDRIAALESERRLDISPLIFEVVKEKVQSFIDSYTEFSDPDEFYNELAVLLGVDVSSC